MGFSTKRSILNLEGSWEFRLDKDNRGIREKWFSGDFQESIMLPGTTDQARLGDFADEWCTDRLSRIWRWIGPAWYRKRVRIPQDWEHKKILLFLERTKDSQVWVDGEWMGSDDSLSTPHVFDLSGALSGSRGGSRGLTPGDHTITLLIDNAKLPPVGPCHQVDERTQTNWNGVVGRIELQAMEKIHIKDVRVDPDPGFNTMGIRVVVENGTNWTGSCDISCSAEVVGHTDAFRIEPLVVGKLLGYGATVFDLKMPLPEGIPAWDEFKPALIDVTVRSEAMPRSDWVRDELTLRCGLLRFTADRGQFHANGRPLFLRGKNDGALFPLTGYAPMDKDEWVRLLSISKSYGFNHYRFHSWCPPEAAFCAADETGVYFQVELPNKREITAPENRNYKPPAQAYETLVELEGDGGPPAARTSYLLREGERILESYGNHPSFVMLTLGNELGGDEGVMRSMVDHFRTLDSRRLFAMGTGHFHWDIAYRRGDDFWVTRATGPDRAVREASYEVMYHLEKLPPSTTVDYNRSLWGVPVPVVAHEMCSFEVFPDFKEIDRYTGVLKARNLEIFKERLEKAGMLDQAENFLRASGALSLLCHREGVEAALRTPGFGGFQMLDLQDFSGQGTALVGMLNVFMESKGIVAPEAWREFCCETVPLLWMSKYVWTNGETFRARIRAAHYGPSDLNGQSLRWTIASGTGSGTAARILACGETPPMLIPTGTVSEIDLIHAELASVRTAQKLTLVLELPGTDYRNRYEFWVYPEREWPAAPEDILIARELSAEVSERLGNGGKVLLLPDPAKLANTGTVAHTGTVTNTVAMSFQSSFWSPMFRMGDGIGPSGKETPGTQGILCDPDHPLFKNFPTDHHTNWQWWHLIKNSRPVILDATAANYRPILQVVDTFARNHKLGLIMEAKCFGGKLLICSIDLLALRQRPEARQLMISVLKYMGSEDFDPRVELSADRIEGLLG